MRLMPLTAEDEDLAIRLECDPEMTRSIGGPRLEVDMRAAHKRRLDVMEQGAAHVSARPIRRTNSAYPAGSHRAYD
jgi:hypothetical protein